MSQVPEGTPTVTSEGRDLAAAVAAAATELGVAPHKVKHKLDMSHFRGENGRPVPRSTVKVIAWVDADAPDEAPAEPRRERRERPEGERRERFDGGEPRAERFDGPRRERADGEPRPERADGPRRERSEEPRRERAEGGEPRRERSEEPRRERSESSEPRRERSDRPPRADRGERGGDRGGDRGARPERRERRDRDDRPASGDVAASGEGQREGLRGPEAGTTEASDYAAAWFSETLKLMDVEGVVTGTGSAERVHLHVKADKAGRIIGKRGSTLASIRHLLLLAMEVRFGSLVLDVDVADERPRTEGVAEPRRERRDSREGGREGGRERRGRDRDDRGGDRGERRGASADETGRHPEEKLQQLAKRAAEKAIETGKTITINLPLNSYDRRIVHLVIQEMAGVSSRSEERDGAKFIQVIPELGSD